MKPPLAWPPFLLYSSSSSFFLSPYFLLECGRRGAAGQPRCRLGGAATTPGTALPVGGPGGRPRLSRAPARTPQSPKSHWEAWAGEVRRARRDAL